MARHRCAIVACARWETAHITEWLTYHAAIGFDHVYLYCNDDDPAELYRQVLPFLVTPNPFVTFIHYPFLGQQRHMYLHALRARQHECNWLMFLDIDEFLYLPRHDTIDAFIHDHARDVDALHVNWQMFGNNGFRERPHGDVLDLYTRHQPGLHPYTKAIVRAGRIDIDALAAANQHFWHHWPHSVAPDRRVNVAGDPIDPYYEDFPTRAVAYLQQPGRVDRLLATAVICHFCLKSEADFDRRVQRGTVGEFTAQLSWGETKANGEHTTLLASLNSVEFLGLRRKWAALHNQARQTSVLPPLAGHNVARGKPALQSSVSPWSRSQDPAQDAAGAVNGTITGQYQFHTAAEPEPWWQVDLQSPVPLTGIRLYNRLDPGQHRATRLTLSESRDGQTWNEIHRKTDPTPIGGLDGHPYQWQPAHPLTTRYIRITLLTHDFLHLDQVEIYARPSTE